MEVDPQTHRLIRENSASDINPCDLNAMELALQLKAALRSAGCEFYLDSCTNQQFLLVSPAQADFLAQRCIFEPLGTWPDGRQCVRLCTSWSTAPARIEALCHELRQLPRA